MKPISSLFEKPIIELPTGNVNEGEEIRQAALREFFEETGLRIQDVNKLMPEPPLNIMPNRTTQMLNVFQVNISKDEYDRRVPHDPVFSAIVTSNRRVN